MADFTPVLPAALYPILDKAHESSLHFIHAPQVLGKYGEALLNWAKQPMGTRRKFIIDSFAFENPGQIPDAQGMFEVAQLLRREGLRLVLICPDVVRNGELTFDLLKQYGPGLKGYGELMIVPHGDDYVSWMSMTDRMLDFCFNMGIHRPWVGLPRYLADYDFMARGRLAAWIGFTWPYIPVHLLGAGQGLAEAASAARIPNVISCDSTSPFAWAYMRGIYDGMRSKIEMPPEAWNMSLEDLSDHFDGCIEALIRFSQLNITTWKEKLRRASASLCF